MKFKVSQAKEITFLTIDMCKCSCPQIKDGRRRKTRVRRRSTRRKRWKSGRKTKGWRKNGKRIKEEAKRKSGIVKWVHWICRCVDSSFEKYFYKFIHPGIPFACIIVCSFIHPHHLSSASDPSLDGRGKLRNFSISNSNRFNRLEFVSFWAK